MVRVLYDIREISIVYRTAVKCPSNAPVNTGSTRTQVMAGDRSLSVQCEVQF
jgi:hypothetical protein